MKISAQDEARVFTLLREHQAFTTPEEEPFSNDILRMFRDTDPATFQKWVDEANEWNAPQLPFAA